VGQGLWYESCFAGIELFLFCCWLAKIFLLCIAKLNYASLLVESSATTGGDALVHKCILLLGFPV
jgi:hypothetical protein